MIPPPPDAAWLRSLTATEATLLVLCAFAALGFANTACGMCDSRSSRYYPSGPYTPPPARYYNPLDASYVTICVRRVGSRCVDTRQMRAARPDNYVVPPELAETDSTSRDGGLDASLPP